MIYINDIYHIKGIYLLAKDLAYNVALDQTEQLTKGIQQLTKKNMHDVSNAINILDSSKEIDGKFDCYKDDGTTAADASKGICAKGTTGGSGKQLSAVFDNTVGQDKFNEKTAKNISDKTTTALNRDQKGVVSSAFAKAHEGA